MSQGDIQIGTQADFYAQEPDIVVTSSIHYDNFNCTQIP